MRRDELVDLAVEREPREGEWRGVVARGEDERGEPLDRLAAGDRDGDAELGDLALDRVEPAASAGSSSRTRLRERRLARAR